MRTSTSRLAARLTAGVVLLGLSACVGPGRVDGASDAPPPDRAGRSEVEPVRVGGPLGGPTRTLYVPPVCSPPLRAAEVNGYAIVELMVGRSGVVVEAKVLRAFEVTVLGRVPVPDEPAVRLLEEAAVAAAGQWRYREEPAYELPAIFTATVVFRCGDA